MKGQLFHNSCQEADLRVILNARSILCLWTDGVEGFQNVAGGNVGKRQVKLVVFINNLLMLIN